MGREIRSQVSSTEHRKGVQVFVLSGREIRVAQRSLVMLMEVWKCRYQPCTGENQVAGYRVGGKRNRKSVPNQRSAQLFERGGYWARRMDRCAIQALVAVEG